MSRCVLLRSALGVWVFGVTVGCSSDGAATSEPGPPASEPGGATTTAPSTPSGGVSTAPLASGVDPSDTMPSPDPSQSSRGIIEPGDPVTLADNLVFGSRLCEGSDDRLYFPNRLGYPTTSGLEEVWSVSKLGGDARRVASPGSSTGCTAVNDEVWVSTNVGNEAFRVNINTLSEDVAVLAEGTPLQLTSDGTTVFASVLRPQQAGSVIVTIDPHTAMVTDMLWAKSGPVISTWLKVQGKTLVFSLNEGGGQSAWIVHIDTETRQSQELVSTTGEVGGIDIAGDAVYYAHHDRGEVRRVSLMDAADSLLANVEGAWSVLVDGDFLYVGARPDYCAGGEGTLHRVPLDGGEPTLLADQLKCPSQLLADQRGLYWINNGTWSGPEANHEAPADSSVLFLPRE